MPSSSADITELRSRARAWVSTPLPDKRALLAGLRRATAAVAADWVRASCHGKGVDPDSPVAGEEWISGPYAVLSSTAALIRLIDRCGTGTGPLASVAARTLPNGQCALRAFPACVQDRVLAGYTAEVWLRPGVTLAQAREGAARRLRDPNLPGAVALVLGAGNISSIPALDTLSLLFSDNAVVMLKLNLVTAYLEPILSRAFADFIQGGFVRITTGGAEVGAHLIGHADSVHITGSAASHDAIVFGQGPDAALRRRERRPLLTKQITSELGGVGPVIVLPGRWSDAALRAQAQNVATQRLHNSGFNCIATQVVLLPERWEQAELFMAYLRAAIRAAPERPAYYPGAADRQRQAARSHPGAELLGGDPRAPRTLIAADPADPAESAFGTEYFAPVLAVTRLPGSSAGAFTDNAVAFCNGRLSGTLGAGLIAHPRTIRELGPHFDAALTQLRYGTVAVNSWVGTIFAMPCASWGAFPGQDVYGVGSGVGSGVGIVHNSLLLDPDHVERTVGRGPFRPWPKPVWYLTNRTANRTGEHMTDFAAQPGLVRALPAMLRALGSSLRG